MSEPNSLPPKPPLLQGNKNTPVTSQPLVEAVKTPPAASYTPFYPTIVEEPQKRSQSLPLLLLVLLLIAVTGMSLFRTQVTTYYQELLGLQPNITAPSEDAPITTPVVVSSEPAPSSGVKVEIQPGVKEENILQSVGAPTDLTITYSDDPAYNCGLVNSDYSKLDLTVGGCYVLEYPNTIFIYYGSNTDYKDRLFVLLHEYGHYQQSQEGLFESPLWSRNDTEQDADCRAISLGADPTVASCPIANWTPDYLQKKYGLV